MTIILQQLLILYMFFFIGWILGKWKEEQISHTGILSFLLVNFFMPCKVFKSFSKNFTVNYLKNNYNVILISLALLFFLVILAKYLSKCLSKNLYEQRIFQYSIPIANYAYLGYVLIENVWGEQALTDMILFCIPFALYTYSFGYALLTGSDNSYKKMLNPITVGILLGMICGLFGVKIPSIVGDLASSASACVGPISMVMTGLTLAGFSIKELVMDKKAYVFSALRLVLLPLLVFGICKLFGFTEVLMPAVIMASMPCGLNTIVFPKLVGQDCKLGAKMAFISHLFSVITLPIWLSILK